MRLCILCLLLSGCGTETSRAGRIGCIERWATERGVSTEEAQSNEHYTRELKK